jgi:tryptophanyl-tRNA synthetase
VLSGIQPTGETHLGNYLGALASWVRDQHQHDSFHPIVDLHALTVPQDPATLRQKTMNMATMLLAAGLDPEVCTLFVQSHVPEHPQLCWLMECTVSLGELQRMTQFKDKSAKQSGDFISAGLLTYPALQAADILLYDANLVPVGDDQRQHVEITRDIANRFNHRYGDTFVVPEASTPAAGARVMDLQAPTNKMSKSADSPQGTVLVLDPPEVIIRKFKRAVTDSGSEVVYDPAEKPGVANLLSILAAVTDTTPQAAAEGFTQYGALKAATGEAVVEALRPVQERYRSLEADPGEVARMLAVGAHKARDVAAKTLERAYSNIGLLPPG